MTADLTREEINALIPALNVDERWHINARNALIQLLRHQAADEANINLKADFIEKTMNQLAEADQKLDAARQANASLIESKDAMEKCWKAANTRADAAAEQMRKRCAIAAFGMFHSLSAKGGAFLAFEHKMAAVLDGNEWPIWSNTSKNWTDATQTDVFAELTNDQSKT